MKLSLPVIADRLNYKFLAPLSSEASLKMRFGRPVFHTGETTLKSDTLYIAYGSSLPPHIELEKGCGLICIGAPDKTASKQRLKDLLILSKYEDIFTVYNSVNEIFDRYEAWEEKLINAFPINSFHTGLETIADVSADLFSHKLTADFNLGCINIDDPNGDASPAEISLLNHLSGFVEKYRQKSSYTGSGKNDFKTLLARGMDTGFINPDVFDSILDEIGWQRDDKYILALISSRNGLAAANLEGLISRFTGEFSYIPVFISSGELMALVNLNAAKKHNLPDESYIRQLDNFLSDTGLHTGISNMFTDFYRMCEYRKQTRTALELGLKNDPDEHIYMFSNYVPAYIRKKILEDFPASELFPSLYYKLKNYDELNNTDYLHTLEVYLEYDMNAVQAANALYIHRATIIYRIKKICEIGQTDLKNKEELLYLQLMLSIQPYENAAKEEEAIAEPEKAITPDTESL